MNQITVRTNIMIYKSLVEQISVYGTECDSYWSETGFFQKSKYSVRVRAYTE